VPSSYEDRQRVLSLKDTVLQQFTGENWLELGLLTGFDDRIRRHDRLLRSLSWGDEDYAQHALNMLLAMVNEEPQNLQAIESYLDEKFGTGGVSVSSTPPRGTRIYFTPTVFEVPADRPGMNLLSVMMPFSPTLRPVYDCIAQIAGLHQMECKRADDIWEHSTVIQDIFSLICRSYIVVCDFSQRNPNVFYEAGIAHTLGKHVIPIAQNIEDIPFDLRQHRTLTYLNNQEGRVAMQDTLSERIGHLLKQRQN
jgi:hypothetical protein